MTPEDSLIYIYKKMNYNIMREVKQTNKKKGVPSVWWVLEASLLAQAANCLRNFSYKIDYISF